MIDRDTTTCIQLTEHNNDLADALAITLEIEPDEDNHARIITETVDVRTTRAVTMPTIIESFTQDTDAMLSTRVAFTAIYAHRDGDYVILKPGKVAQYEIFERMV